jgi:hypothetical protein
MKRRTKASFSIYSKSFVYSKKAAFSREKDAHKVLVILNLSNTTQSIKITDTSAIGIYTDIFSDSSFSLTSEKNIQLTAWGYLVLAK